MQSSIHRLDGSPTYSADWDSSSDSVAAENLFSLFSGTICFSMLLRFVFSFCWVRFYCFPLFFRGKFMTCSCGECVPCFSTIVWLGAARFSFLRAVRRRCRCTIGILYLRSRVHRFSTPWAARIAFDLAMRPFSRRADSEIDFPATIRQLLGLALNEIVDGNCCRSTPKAAEIIVKIVDGELLNFIAKTFGQQNLICSTEKTTSKAAGFGQDEGTARNI